MIRLILAAIAAFFVLIFGLFVYLHIASRGAEIGSVGTNFRLFGPSDAVQVQRLDDPVVPGVSCFVSFAQTGGIVGGVGLAEDPSRFALSCVAHGAVALPPGLPDSQDIGNISAGAFFKHFSLTRMVDRQTNTLVYVLTSTKLLHGSPANAVSAVPAS